MQTGPFDQAERVNREVNGSITYRSDQELFNRPDFWTIVQTAGDCDDYSLTKRHRLLLLGWPLEALRLAVVFTDTYEGQFRLRMRRGGLDNWMGDHLNLIASTERGDFCLDNMFPHPIELSLTGHTIDRIQMPGRFEWEYGRTMVPTG